MSGFKSDAQRKHFFANGGGSGANVPSFPTDIEAEIARENAESDTPEERAKSWAKEERKAHDMQAMFPDVGDGFQRMTEEEISERNRVNNDGRIFRNS